MKRYIRSTSAASKSQIDEMKQIGHAIQYAAKAYPEKPISAFYKDTTTGEKSRVPARILSSIKYVNTTQCFVSISFNCIVENISADEIAEYAINAVDANYPGFEFKFGKYGSFRGHDLGVWVTRRNNT